MVVELLIEGESIFLSRKWSFTGEDSDSEESDSDGTFADCVSGESLRAQCWGFSRRVALEYGLSSSEQERVRRVVQGQISEHPDRHAARVSDHVIGVVNGP